MIARIAGNLVERDGNRAVVDVRGVGYEVFAPERTLEAWSDDDVVTAHISTQVREDAIVLYGFATALDRRAFDVLLSVSGVGPKMALAALESMDVASLQLAVETDDTRALSSINGVGAKTAKRMALELKGKLPAEFSPTSARQTRAPMPKDDPLVIALTQLEYGRAEIDRTAGALVDQGLGPEASLQDRIRAALKILSGGGS